MEGVAGQLDPSRKLSPREILTEAMLAAIRQVGDGLALQGRQLEKMNEKLDLAANRLTAIESNRVSERIVELERVVDELRTERDRRRGAVAFVDLVFKFAPWGVALIAAIAAYVTTQRKGI